MRSLRFSTFGFFALLLIFSGCGNYTSSTRAAREEFYSGQYTESAKRLEKGAHEDGTDQLLYLFDRATALHHAQDYEESNKDFHLADKLAEIKDYTSLATEAATLLSNDKIKHYKGEDFENVLITQYLGLNYLMLRKYEDALVECRRVNHKLHLMISQGKRKYKLNPMARYLAAMMYEDQQEWDDAYIDYQGVHELLPAFPYLGEDLYRLAWKTKNSQDMDRWAKEYEISAEDQKRIRETAQNPEIILIIENGKAPEKQPHPMWYAIPKFFPRPNPIAYAQVSLNGEDQGRSYTLFDVERTAIENLDEKYAGILAKKIAGVVAKEVVADQIGRRTDPLIGLLLKIGFYAADQADLRSWLTLPKDFQVFRLRVPKASKAPKESEPESYKIQIQPRTADGFTAGRAPIEKLVHFDSHKQFLHIRIW